MTLSEFKAWLDGFSDAMGDAPTPEQWAKIKAKLAQVQAAPHFNVGSPKFVPSLPPSFGPYPPNSCGQHVPVIPPYTTC